MIVDCWLINMFANHLFAQFVCSGPYYSLVHVKSSKMQLSRLKHEHGLGIKMPLNIHKISFNEIEVKL